MSDAPKPPWPESERSWLLRLAKRLVGRRLRSKVDPEDLTQDVLLDASRRQSELHFEGSAPRRGWLSRVLRNRAVDLARKRGGRENAGESHLGRVPGRGTTPLSAAMRSESDLAVQRQLRGLDERERKIVLMRVVEDLSFGEIAERMAVSEENARAIFSRSSRRLQKRGPLQG